MKEVWKDIKGYEKFYQVSSLGRIKRKPRLKRLINNKYQVLPEMILSTNSINSYPSVSLNNGKFCKTFAIHRLVALHFIDNDDPKNKREVNHIDKNIKNFSIDNLEWCTRSYNISHSRRSIYL